LNALTTNLAMAVNDALGRIAGRSERRGGSLSTGAGRAFCAAGTSVQWRPAAQKGAMQDLGAAAASGDADGAQHAHDASTVICAVTAPPQAAGMNIALAADIRIASEEASFGQNLRRWIIPRYGGTFFLPQLVGREGRGAFLYR